MEVWDRDTYRQYEEASNKDFEDIAEKINSSEDEK
jgi:DNA-binding transcriptional regulator/RsmH inhibitor MraZ